MDIQHDLKKNLFLTTINGDTAYVDYRIDNHELDIRHTIVPKPLEGQGIAAALVKTAYDYALSHQLTPVATCAYAVAWLKRHPEYHGQIGKDYCEGNSCVL